MTLTELRRLAELLPPGTSLTIAREALLEMSVDGPSESAPWSRAAMSGTWRERLWTCPPDTRLGVRQVAEAMGRPRSWVYRAASPKRGLNRLPARRLDGELVFEAGAVRAWVKRCELPLSP